MKIKVTQKDIDQGQRSSTHACPIALAIRRRFPRAIRVSVMSYRVDVHRTLLTADDRVYTLPPDAKLFIGMFDSGGGGSVVKPFTFEMEEKC